MSSAVEPDVRLRNQQSANNALCRVGVLRLCIPAVGHRGGVFCVASRAINKLDARGENKNNNAPFHPLSGGNVLLDPLLGRHKTFSARKIAN